MTTRHFTPAQARVRATLIHRLIDRHGLTEAEADNALTEAECGLDGPHTHLVSIEARTCLAEATALVIKRLEAMRPIVRAVCDCMRRFAEQPRAAEATVTQDTAHTNQKKS